MGSVQKEEQQFPWHFDGADFIVTIQLQKPMGGGKFQYYPNTRTPDNEKLDSVRNLLNGDMRNVKTLELNPGDLQLFKGRYSAHRVTGVSGSTTRYLATLCYTPEPAFVNTVERSLINTGRALEEHYKRDKELRGATLGS